MPATHMVYQKYKKNADASHRKLWRNLSNTGTPKITYVVDPFGNSNVFRSQSELFQNTVKVNYCRLKEIRTVIPTSGAPVAQ